MDSSGVGDVCHFDPVRTPVRPTFRFSRVFRAPKLSRNDVRLVAGRWGPSLGLRVVG